MGSFTAGDLSDFAYNKKPGLAATLSLFEVGWVE